MHTRFNGQNKSWTKILAFLKSDSGRAKNLKPRKITVSGLSNLFTFEKFPPPPPLLHHRIWMNSDTISPKIFGDISEANFQVVK